MKQLLILIAVFLFMINNAFAQWSCCDNCPECCEEYRRLRTEHIRLMDSLYGKQYFYLVEEQKKQISQLQRENTLLQEQNNLFKEHIKIRDPSLYEPLIQAPNLQSQNEILLHRLPPPIMLRYLPPQ
jgi:hypothetical protein